MVRLSIGYDDEQHQHSDRALADRSPKADRLYGGCAGRLVRSTEGNVTYWAFVPDPLPPSLALDLPLQRLLSEADRAIGELAGLARRLPNPHLLVQPFIRREAVLSSRIEGTEADIQDVYAYEAGQLELPGVSTRAGGGDKAPSNDVIEVMNYIRALDLGLERVQETPVNRWLIRELHTHLMAGARGEEANPGQFRRRQNFIGVPGSRIEQARFIPLPPAHLDEALEQFERSLTVDDYPPLIRLALMHYQFETIHPFVDGNGRIGRLLISLLLCSWQLLPLPLLYLSAFFERNRPDYYNLLRAVSERGAWNEWISFFLSGVIEQAVDATTRAQQLQDLQERWRQQLTQGRSTALQLTLVDDLFVTPIVSIKSVQVRLNVTYRTARLAVLHLVEAGILHQMTSGPYSRFFVADRVIEIAAR